MPRAVAAALLGALGLTLAVELPLGALMFRRPRERCLHAVVAVLLMNIATNPTLNLALLLVGTVHRTAFVVFGEAAVVAVEMLVLRRALGRRAQARLSLVAALEHCVLYRRSCDRRNDMKIFQEGS